MKRFWMSQLDKYNQQPYKQRSLHYHTDKEDNMSPVHFLMVIIYFASLLFLFYYFKRTIMDFLVLFCIYLLFASAAFLVPISFYRKKLSMSFYEFTILNMIGVAPLLLTLSLGVNFHLSSGEQTESYKIIRRQMDRKDMILYLENNALKEHDFLRTLDEEELQQENGMVADSLFITFADGLLGYKVIKNRSFN